MASIDLGGVNAAVGTGLLGLVAGYLVRRHEYLREQRLRAYATLMRRSFAYLDSFVDTELGWQERWDENVRLLNDSWCEVLLVASRSVVAETVRLQEWCEEQADTYMRPRILHAHRGGTGVVPVHGPTLAAVSVTGQTKVEQWALKARGDLGFRRNGSLRLKPVREIPGAT